jgi:hypothetical protein
MKPAEAVAKPIIEGVEVGGRMITGAIHMRDALFTSPTAAGLAKVVDLLDSVPMEIATPGATSTSTCSARSRRPGRMANAERRHTSFAGWSVRVAPAANAALSSRRTEVLC